MQTTRMRPTFSVELPRKVNEVMESIQSQIASADYYGRAISKGRCVDLHVDNCDRKLWSPYLSVQAYDEGMSTVLFGRYSPRPEIWTFIIFLFAFNAFIAVFGAMFAVGQLSIGHTPWGLGGVVFGVVTSLAIHATSLVGQRVCADQMVDLRETLDALLHPLDIAKVATSSDQRAK